MKIATRVFIFCFGLAISTTAFGQREQAVAEVDQPSPVFTLDPLEYYPKTSISLAQLRGTHVILDFFSSGCSACFESFPKLNAIQKKFKPGLQIFLVGRQEHNLPQTYARFREKQRLQIPVSFDDTQFARFGVYGVPFLVWIDDHGIVRAITSTTELDDSSVSAFVHNRPFLARNVSRSFQDSGRRHYDSSFILDLRPFQDKWLSASSLVAWNPAMPIITDRNLQFRYAGAHAFCQINGTSILQLINFAFIGKFAILSWDSLYEKQYPFPIFEMDSSEIPVRNYSTGMGMYCYSLEMPAAEASIPRLQKKLQSDIQEGLGFDIRLEDRMMPCWLLTARPGVAAQLKSTHQKKSVTADWTWMDMQYAPMSTVIQDLYLNDQNGPPYIDATGISGKIDLRLDALMTDFDDLRRSLSEHGLDLTRSKKMMRVLVVRKKHYE
jgi:thiol-disulfide isomerase/thioredoxin